MATAIATVVFAPTAKRLSRSRPSSSAPRGCAVLGVAKREARSILTADSAGRTAPAMAKPATSANIADPTIALVRMRPRLRDPRLERWRCGLAGIEIDDLGLAPLEGETDPAGDGCMGQLTENLAAPTR